MEIGIRTEGLKNLNNFIKYIKNSMEQHGLLVYNIEAAFGINTLKNIYDEEACQCWKSILNCRNTTLMLKPK